MNGGDAGRGISATTRPEARARFVRDWWLTGLLTAIGLGVLWWAVDDLRARVNYLLALWVGFAGFTWVAYRAGEAQAGHPNPARLLNYVMVLTFAKMAFGIALVFGYARWARPGGIDFVWPFFWTYLTYTTQETLALVRLSFATSPKRRDV